MVYVIVNVSQFVSFICSVFNVVLEYSQSVSQVFLGCTCPRGNFIKSELLSVLMLSAATEICPEISSWWMALSSACLVENLIPPSRRVSAS